MNRILVFLVGAAAAVFPLAPPGARAQQPAIQQPGLGIHVVDASDAPVVGAQVVVAGTGLQGVSDQSGWVRLRTVPPGRVAVRVTRLGFQPSEFSLEVPPSGSLEVDVELVPGPVRVEGVTAVGAAENRALATTGFYRRKEAGGGAFLTREDIDMIGVKRTSEVFRRVRGVRVIYAGKNKWKLMGLRFGASMSQSAGSRSRNGATCEMVTFLDGNRIYLDGIDDISLEGVEAIEVYRGTTEVPPEFRVTDAACGVAALWTRRRGS